MGKGDCNVKELANQGSLEIRISDKESKEAGTVYLKFEIIGEEEP